MSGCTIRLIPSAHIAQTELIRQHAIKSWKEGRESGYIEGIKDTVEYMDNEQNEEADLVPWAQEGTKKGPSWDKYWIDGGGGL